MTDLVAVVASPQGWHDHLRQSAANGTVTALENALADLPPSDAVMGRRGQLLMRRRQYLDAVELLGDWQGGALCRAVTALALTGLGDVAACRRVLEEFASVPGESTTLLHIEAHYRLRYARGLALAELGQVAGATVELQTASGIASALGFLHVSLVIRLEVAKFAWRASDWERALLELGAVIAEAHTHGLDTLRRRAMELSLWVTLLHGGSSCSQCVTNYPEGDARRIMMAGAGLLDGIPYALPPMSTLGKVLPGKEHSELLRLLHAFHGLRHATLERCAGNLRAARAHVTRVRALTCPAPDCPKGLAPSHDPLYRNLLHLCLGLACVQDGAALDGQALIVGELPAPQLADHPLIVVFRACAALEAMIWSDQVPDSRRYPLTRATSLLADALGNLPPQGRRQVVRLLGQLMPDSLLLLTRSDYGHDLVEVHERVASMLILEDRAVVMAGEPLAGYQRELPSTFSRARSAYVVLPEKEVKRLQRYRKARRGGPDASAVVCLPDVRSAVIRALAVSSALEGLSWQRLLIE